MYRPFKRLRTRMMQMDYCQKELAQAAGIPTSTLSQRMSGKRPFDTQQISALCRVLEIKPEEVGLYFFEPVPQSKKAG